MVKPKRKRPRKAIRPRPTISLCMIVRDEERDLPEALKSVQGLVDEMIIVDTGSTDRTVEIAEAAGAKVIHEPWEDSFSKARNVSLMAATGGWILILDADEYIEKDQHALIRKTVNRNDIDVVMCPNINLTFDGGAQWGIPYNPRLFRNRKDYFYHGRVHNQLHSPGRTETLPIRIIHKGYGLSPEEMRRKWTRTKGLLYKTLEDDPTNGFQHYNLCVCLNNLREFDAGLVHAARAIEYSPNGSEIQQMGRYMRAIMCRALGDRRSAIRDCRAALAEDPNYIDALYVLAELLTEDGGDSLEVVTLFEHYLYAEEKERTCPAGHHYILNCIGLGYVAYFHIGNMHAKFGGYQRALTAWRQSLAFEPHPPFEAEIYANMGQVFLAQNEWKEALCAHEKVVTIKPDDALSWNNIGVAKRNLGDNEGAIAAFRKATEAAPGLELALKNLSAMGVDTTSSTPTLRGDSKSGVETPEPAVAPTLTTPPCSPTILPV